jgi:hypothetical protein
MLCEKLMIAYRRQYEPTNLRAIGMIRDRTRPRVRPQLSTKPARITPRKLRTV